jgi:hypothetical protein
MKDSGQPPFQHYQQVFSMFLPQIKTKLQPSPTSIHNNSKICSTNIEMGEEGGTTLKTTKQHSIKDILANEKRSDQEEEREDGAKEDGQREENSEKDQQKQQNEMHQNSMASPNSINSSFSPSIPNHNHSNEPFSSQNVQNILQTIFQSVLSQKAVNFSSPPPSLALPTNGGLSSTALTNLFFQKSFLPFPSLQLPSIHQHKHWMGLGEE